MPVQPTRANCTNRATPNQPAPMQQTLKLQDCHNHGHCCQNNCMRQISCFVALTLTELVEGLHQVAVWPLLLDGFQPCECST